MGIEPMASTALSRDAASIEAKPASGASRWRSYVFTALKLGLSALAIGIVFYTVDLSAAWQRVTRQDPWLLALAALVMMVQIGIGGLRWHVILVRLGATPPITESLRLYYISVFFNTYLWGAVGGDVVRAWLSYRARLSATMAVNSVVLDRVALLAGVGVLVLVTLPLFVSRAGFSLVSFVPAGIAFSGLCAILAAAQLDRLPKAWQNSRPLRLLQALGSATRSIFLRPSSALPAVGLGVAAQIALALSTYATSQSLGLHITLLDLLVLMPPVALITALPISIGGWGVRETAMIGLLGIVGVAPADALLLSVQIGLISILVSLPGGLLWLTLRSSVPMQSEGIAAPSTR